MSADHPLARGLATALLAGPWSLDALVERANTVLEPGSRRRWVRPLARRVLEAFGDCPPPRWKVLVEFIARDPALRRALEATGGEWPAIDTLRLPPAVMTPVPAIREDWHLPAIVTSGALAEWLGLLPNELDWFADSRGRARGPLPERLRHYRYRWIAKSSGRRRLLEIPKARLKAIQRVILHDVLDCVPPHPAAHAFRRGRSITTCLTPHVGKRVVLHVDLREFFPSIRSARVHALFRTLGYPEGVARTLTGLCTTVVPDDVLREAEYGPSSRAALEPYLSPHLPQGAPTSPAIANLCAYRLDCRLNGLARKVGVSYTRYADDLVFSGGPELDRCLARFRILTCAIILDEGFEIRRRKTRVMRGSGRQQVAGIVLNARCNLPRDEYDRLRAILYNCDRHGPTSQNHEDHQQFREHLLGRIAWFATINPVRGERLRRLFEQIDWSGGS